MNKIIDYINKGRGIGALIILALSTFYAAYYSSTLSVGYDFAVPYVQNVIEQITPIKVVNGKVVTPADTVKKIKLVEQLSDSPYLIIDTTRDTLDISRLSTGIYLTRSNLYTVSNREVRTKPLAGNFELPRDDYTDAMFSIKKWVIAGFFVFLCIGLFFCYLMAMLFYSLVIKIAESINKKSLTFDESMRFNTVLFTGLSLSLFILNLIGISFGNFIFFVVMIILQIVFMNKVKN